jgi:hypothetical protein
MLTQQSNSCRRGGEQFLAEPRSPGFELNFRTFHRLTPSCSGAERLARFSKLSADAQDRTWRALARELEVASA